MSTYTTGKRTVDVSFDQGELDAFKAICTQTTDPKHYPLATSIEKNIPIFAASAFESRSSDSQGRTEIMDQLYHCLSEGPGVFVVKDLMQQPIVDRANMALETIVREENEEKRKNGLAGGDHFAPGGANERIWNSFQKHAMVDPDNFVEYYSNDLLSLICESWLGPGYQITAQTNIVKPGGKAQQPHRDYHLGFQSASTTSKYPTTSQQTSQYLTLQLAIAHSPMPLNSGPTLFLPFSQLYTHGYLSYRLPQFAQYFQENYVQLPLDSGDAVFFNPALVHAAGENYSGSPGSRSGSDEGKGVRRIANLMQVSAAWGRPMEIVDRDAILKHTWSSLRKRYRDDSSRDSASADANGKAVSSLDQVENSPTAKIEAIVKAIGDGYSFPTNLDRDPPPPDGHCPPSHQDLIWKGLQEDWSDEELKRELGVYQWKHSA